MSYVIQTNKTEAQCQRLIRTEFERWNRAARRDGEGEIIGRADFPPPADLGSTEAMCRFELRGTTITVACASQPTYRQNLRAVGMAIEAMRKNEARGIADTLRKAYLQLEAPALAIDPYEVLGVRPDSPLEDIEAMYTIKAKRVHPDTGTGDEKAMKQLNAAIERIREERAEA